MGDESSDEDADEDRVVEEDDITSSDSDGAGGAKRRRGRPSPRGGGGAVGRPSLTSSKGNNSGSDSAFGASIQTVSTAADSHQCQSHSQTYESCYEGNSGSRCRQEVTTRQQQKIHYEDCYG